MHNIKKVYFFSHFLFLLFGSFQKSSCIYPGNNYISELFKLGIFDKNTMKIKNEIYENIDKTHQIFSSCKTCIKLIQLLIKIIKNKKENYIDIAIEEALEINLCNPQLWKQYFNYDELLYNEYVVDNCKYTHKLVKEHIEDSIYKLYKNEKLFYQHVCEQIHDICKKAIEEAQNSSNNSFKIKLMYDLYSQYLVEHDNYNRTPNGIPYKIIEKYKNNSNQNINKNSYIIIQSQIKNMNQIKIYDDFKSELFRVIKMNKLNDEVAELFIKVGVQNMVTFIFYNQLDKNGQMSNGSILDIKIIIYDAMNNIEDLVSKNYKNKLLDNDETFLLYK
ncbi:conserved Plasmodium protein, unknown function [Plasmodium chabaudi chabaudi]|uniref:Uncharacterized protein n=1 Tax=Plasmodium chabaudi chabaudi TaxID=31271 RepID=A0A1D3RZD1_PLACU|nr:conserved Plasmodium protein, unknown function [Plasmodium chabaudi chabaudi]